MDKPEKKPFTNRRSGSRRPVAVRLSQIQDTRIDKRKYVFIITAIIALVFAFGYIWYANARTSDIAKSISSSRQSADTPITSLRTQYQKMTTVERASLLDRVKDSVASPGCSSFYIFYPPLEKVQKQCTSAASQVVSLKTASSRFAKLLRYDATLQATINKALQINNDKSANWQAKQKAWSQCVTSLKQLTPPDELKTEQKDLVTRLEKLVSAWNALNKADDSKKLTDYKKAKQTLTATYSTVQKSAEQYELKYEVVQADFVAAYKAFKKQ